jgi:hypothetical protein
LRRSKTYGATGERKKADAAVTALTGYVLA